jgi:hypothetical protein
MKSSFKFFETAFLFSGNYNLPKILQKLCKKSVPRCPVFTKKILTLQNEFTIINRVFCNGKNSRPPAKTGGCCVGAAETRLCAVLPLKNYCRKSAE